MLGQVLRVLLLLFLVGLLLYWLTNREQKRRIHHTAWLLARVLLVAAAVSLAWRLFSFGWA